jgi:hypothetical protein
MICREKLFYFRKNYDRYFLKIFCIFVKTMICPEKFSYFGENYDMSGKKFCMSGKIWICSET